MRKRIRIGSKGKGKEKEKNPGALRYEALAFLAKTEGDVAMWECHAWVHNLLTHLEDRFTPIRPSVSDRAALMTAIVALVAEKPPPGAPENIQGAAVYLAASMGLDVSGEPQLRWFPDSPDAGNPLCICSYCDCLIEEGTVPIRFFGEDKTEHPTDRHIREQRFHPDCFQTCIEFRLVDPDTMRRI